MSLSDFDNPQKQGTVGLGRAISYFTSQGVEVALPLNDTQKYDLIVRRDGEFKSVQVKTTYYQEDSGGYSVMLADNQSNRTETKIKEFRADRYDLLFVLVLDGRMFLIPTGDIDSNHRIVVGANKWNEYEVTVG